MNTAIIKSSADPIIYKFEITETIKGKQKKQVIEIASQRNGSSCGYKFELGKSYLVYSRKSAHFSTKTKNEIDFVTSLCDRNQILENTRKREFRQLKKLNRKIEN